MPPQMQIPPLPGSSVRSGARSHSNPAAATARSIGFMRVSRCVYGSSVIIQPGCGPGHALHDAGAVGFERQSLRPHSVCVWCLNRGWWNSNHSRTRTAFDIVCVCLVDLSDCVYYLRAWHFAVVSRQIRCRKHPHEMFKQLAVMRAPSHPAECTRIGRQYWHTRVKKPG